MSGKELLPEKQWRRLEDRGRVIECKEESVEMAQSNTSSPQRSEVSFKL